MYYMLCPVITCMITCYYMLPFCITCSITWYWATITCHYMLPFCITCSITWYLDSYYTIFCLQLHVFAIYYMPYHVTSLVAAAAEAPRAIATRAISARAISSPFSVGFILPENNPARSDSCEVLAAYGYGGGQHEVLACPGCDCKIFKQSCQDQRLNQLDQTLWQSWSQGNHPETAGEMAM